MLTVHWSKPASIVPPALATSDRYYVGLSVAPNGRLDMAWYDYRNIATTRSTQWAATSSTSMSITHT
ncbi:MAG: hypothetical protein ACRDUW_25175, partial [Pseudonocardiaceae bacterium]